MPERIENQPPVPLVLAICDRIHQDPASEKFTLLGMFSWIAGIKFPLVAGRFGVYVELTDGRGQTNIEIALTDVDEANAPLFSAEQTVQFRDPREVIPLSFALQNVTFPKPGEYRLRVTSGGSPLGERRIILVTRTPPGE